MTTEEGAKVVAARHLEATANAAKNFTVSLFAQASVSGGGETYTLPTANATTKGGVKIGNGLAMDGETLNVTISGGTSDEVFTGATSQTAGTSGNVPAPAAGDREKFLRGDGTWAVVADTNLATELNAEKITRANADTELQTAITTIQQQIASVGGGNYTDFTGATSNSNGVSGLVPAPQTGEQDRFLRGDGTWARVKQAGSSDYIIGSTPSGVEGGLWKDTINDVPVLKLRHGDYEYNFNYDDVTYLGGASSTLETVPPDTYVIGTASSTVDGGIWYKTDPTTTLNMHNGSFDYSFKYDSVTYKGGNKNLVAYLPFDTGLADACGNKWTAFAGGFGEVSINTETKKFGAGSIYVPRDASLSTPMPFDINTDKWTFDCWCYPVGVGGYGFTITILGCDIQGKTLAGIRLDTNYLHIANTDGTAVAVATPVVNFPAYKNWYHIALVKNGSSIMVFRDGVMLLNQTYTDSIGGAGYFGLGMSGSTNTLLAYYDNVRLFEGVALWTDNFTPPAAADYE